MKKSYRFNLSTWATPATARQYRAVLKDWIAENDGVKTPLYVADEAYVWATDKDMLHLVLEDGERWEGLPSRLDRNGSEILDVLITKIECREEYTVADELEDDLLDYLSE